MTKWEYPNIKVPTMLLEVTDEMLTTWEKENKRCEAYNKLLESQLIERKQRMITDASFIWGEKSNVVRYLTKIRISMPSLTFFDSIKNNVLKAREDEKQRLLNTESQQKIIELQGNAVKYLIENGKAINIDFMVDNAISMANSIAYDKAIANQQKELFDTESYIDFNGSDSCENCAGWDGTSRRCQCGNRRVGWASGDNADFFLNPYIYGEAW